MGTAFSEIPVVDIAALFGNDEAAQAATAEALRLAASNVGFLYITGHGLNPALFETMLDATKGFFALPVEEKMRVYIGKSSNHRGYVPEGEEVFTAGTKDAKEAYDLSRDLPADDPDYLAGNPLLGPNQWPDLPDFAACVSTYYNAAFEIGRVLMRGFALALGEAADAFDPLLTKPPSQLRLIHYPFNPEAEDKPGIGAHTDYECFTLLRATSPGLEVLNAAGEWIDVPPRPDAYVVNIGDMLELWTNGKFVATSHRVRKVKEERYSFPLFFTVDYHTKISPMPQFITAEKPARPGLVAGEHLFAQTAQTFTYQVERLKRGELALPEASLGISTSFGQQVKLGVVEKVN
jgi:isopenicillin N synthase-like dioxygenase